MRMTERAYFEIEMIVRECRVSCSISFHTGPGFPSGCISAFVLDEIKSERPGYFCYYGILIFRGVSAIRGKTEKALIIQHAVALSRVMIDIDVLY
jgi:hypothetical protein